MARIEDRLEELEAREAIRDRLYRYCRAMDRCDADLLLSVYWPDAEVSQLDYRGGPEGLIAWAFPQIGAMDLIQHQIGNVLIERVGDHATVESFFLSYIRLARDGTLSDNLSGGRYLDRFERRDDEWRIRERLVVPDWGRVLAGTPERGERPFGAALLHPRDVSYGWFNGGVGLAAARR